MKLDYGKEGIEINLDPEWNVTVFHPLKKKPTENPIEKIKESIKMGVAWYEGMYYIVGLKDSVNLGFSVK